jgi:phage terminase small subunit
MITKDKEKPLNEKQLRFCQEYIVDLNGSQAAIRAGYSADTSASIASELLTKPNILSYLNDILYERAERTKVTADYVITSLRELIQRCLQKKPVMIFDKVEKEYIQKTCLVEDEDDVRHEEGVWEFDSQGANKALETLAKHLKLLTDKPVFIDNSKHITYNIQRAERMKEARSRVHDLATAK